MPPGVFSQSRQVQNQFKETYSIIQSHKCTELHSISYNASEQQTWFEKIIIKQHLTAQRLSPSKQIKCIYIALRTSADISECCTETQPKTPNSKQCRFRSTLARKNSLGRPKPRKKPREEPGYEGWRL
jgi:hypothetical protein